MSPTPKVPPRAATAEAETASTPALPPPEFQCFSDDEKLGLALWPEPWASQTTVQADYIGWRARLAAGENPTPTQREIVTAIYHMLRHAQESSTRRHWWQRPLDRWRGTSLERAHSNLHAAKLLLVDLLSEQDIDALIPSAIACVATLKRRDSRRSSIEVSLSGGLLRADQKRAQVKRALEIGYDALDQHHSRVRGFRNLLIIVSAVIALFMTGLVFVVYQWPDSMPLCFEPNVTATGDSAAGAPPSTSAPPQSPGASPIATPSASGAPQTPAAAAPGTSMRKACPSGQDPPQVATPPRESTSADILIVAGLGLFGGAVAAAFAIRKVRGTSTPYDVPLALAILKVPTGALTAVVGIVLLGGGFVPGLSELDSQRQILAYALIFRLRTTARDTITGQSSREYSRPCPKQGSRRQAAATIGGATNPTDAK